MELSSITDNLHDELLLSLIILINWCYAQFCVNIYFIYKHKNSFSLLFNASQIIIVFFFFFNGSSAPDQVTMI